MTNVYVPNIEVGPHDDKISEIYRSHTENDFGGYQMTIFIQNEKGEVYRKLAVSGLANYIGAVNEIWGLGLIDLHKDEMRASPDSLFAHPAK
ncbi:MAG: hypothetical protein RSD49_08415 [Hafnia sp.]